MPRSLRYFAPGAVYHLISRFVGNEWFIARDEDREQYLRFLGAALSESDWRCLAYAVMSNHIHLQMLAGAASLSSWMRRAHSPFADWMNRQRDRIGPVFIRGPKDHGVRTENIGKTIAYIHNNPVRAGVVRRAKDSTWTSHAAYLGLAPAPAWLDIQEGLARSGFDDLEAFDRWVMTAPNQRPDIDLAKVRRAARCRGVVEVGTPTIGECVEVPLLMRPWAHVRVDPRLIVEATCEELGLAMLDVCSRRRSREIVAARLVAVHCANRLGLTGADIAAALGLSRQAVSAMHRKDPKGVAVQAFVQRVLARCRQQVDQVASDPDPDPR
ncbi:MAG: hypothetical protein AB7P03_04835 [Kofleriaceae bacterium]